jgi:predicted ATPase
MKKTILQSIAVRNFKAIVDSRTVSLTPLTVLIGNNGSGKSSLFESLRTYQTFVLKDIDAAMGIWKGIEHIRNKAAGRSSRPDPLTGKPAEKPISVKLRGRLVGQKFGADVAWNSSESEQLIYTDSEDLSVGKFGVSRDRDGQLRSKEEVRGKVRPLSVSALTVAPGLRELRQYIESWQFLSLSPQDMGYARPTTRSRSRVILAEDGANIVEYLDDIYKADPSAFQGIVDSLRYVLPYANDVQVTGVTTEIEKSIYLRMTEKEFKVPGWMLSTGTLRILAILAVLRHPTPPPLVLIEELENGLDPRTLNLLKGEFEAANEAGIQIIATTHSPYLLDSVPLESVVLVDRVDGQPNFSRPADDAAIRAWAKEFSTGQLYTMSRLNARRAK